MTCTAHRGLCHCPTCEQSTTTPPVVRTVAELLRAHPVLGPLANPYVTPAGHGYVKAWVPGVPATQGSKDYVGSRHYARESNRRLPAWRSDVREALRRADGTPLHRFTGPVSCGLEFLLRRPLRSRHGDHPAGKPDLDKLTRAVLDAATEAGVLEDDARVVQFHLLVKRWAGPEELPGCRIEFRGVGA